MANELRDALTSFVSDNGVKTQGPLSIALLVTHHAKKQALPLNPGSLLTPKGGQVKGAGGPAVQKILVDHGVIRRLSSEGGRTSRGSIDFMRAYVALLNALHDRGICNLDEIERFWVERVHGYFASEPFTIKLDASRSLRTVIRDVIAQAIARQREAQGTNYAGAVLQHLVGAKLECALGEGKVKHNSFSTADAPGKRAGDFLLEDVAVHVTTSPSEALIDKCQDNLNDGLRPILVTLQKGATAAEGLADIKGLADRIDIFEIEQFVALNLYEFAEFAADARKTAVIDLVGRYNHIIDSIETDPSLKIEFRK